MEVAIAPRALIVFTAGFVLLTSTASASTGENRAAIVRALNRMMVTLGPESARASRTIREAYREHLGFLFLDGYSDLEGALATGGIAPLPAQPRSFNLLPRVDGPSPIGEKDLDHQHSYVAARPATIGCLLEVASRVKSGPVEITSLVRHGEYQAALKSTNKNATTAVPMHAMGLAFDIALVNSSLETAYEIRNVLRAMEKSGDLLFVGERRQLVFHVVPHPSRLGHFTDVYQDALGAPPASSVAHVVARDPLPPTEGSPGPRVTVDIAAIRPADVTLNEIWWPASPVGQPGTPDFALSLATAAPVSHSGLTAALVVRGGLGLFGGLLAGVRRARRSRPRSARLFDVEPAARG